MSIRQRHKRFVVAVIGRRYEKTWIVFGPHTLKHVQKAMRNNCWRADFRISACKIFELVEVKENKR